MNSLQADLYQRLQKFELDDPTHEFGFTRHLMKNHGWTRDYAQRAIAEYKKFAFLTVVTDHQVVPSDQVDQVWHAHVLLTQSYWDEFCPKVLGKGLHHHPARGGRAERAEFHRLYAQTIASYRHFFGSPPIDIWSPPDLRFGVELKMQRVSLSEHWIIPKRLPQVRFNLRLAQFIGIASVIAFVTVGCAVANQESTLGKGENSLPIDQGVALFSAAVLFGLLLRYYIRRPYEQPQKPQLDVYQMAYLAGGSSRAVDLAITQLVHQGYLRPNVRHRTFAIEKMLPSEANSLEQQVMQQIHQTPDLKSLRQPNKYRMDFLDERWEQERLLMTGWAVWAGMSFLFFITSIIFIAMLVSALLSVLETVAEPNIVRGLSVILFRGLWVVGIITLCCFVPSRRTRWGSRVLEDLWKNHDVYDVTQRFALYGYPVLSGGVLEDLKQIFQAEAEAESSTGGCGCGC